MKKTYCIKCHSKNCKDSYHKKHFHIEKRKTMFKAGDIVRHNRKVYIVSEVKSWLHKGDWISLIRKMGEVSLLTRVEEVSLIKPREEIKKNFWLIFPEGEK